MLTDAAPSTPSAALTDPAYWRALMPALHVNDPAFIAAQAPLALDAAAVDTLRARVREDGYFHLPPQPWDLPIDTLAEAVTRLDAEGLPLPFAFMYDEFWALFWRLDRVLEGLLGPGYHRLPDFWVWRVDAQRGAAGWRPHRDKGADALFPDGTPRSFTIWLPLTDATPTNSCIYVLPADRDPDYRTLTQDVRVPQLADVRALPAAAGSALGWTQALLHWGSATHPRETQPRISVAFEFQSANTPPMNVPLTSPREIPPLALRLQLIGKQLLQYRHMYPLAAPVERLAQALVRG